MLISYNQDVHMNRLLPTRNIIKYGFFNSKKREVIGEKQNIFSNVNA